MFKKSIVYLLTVSVLNTLYIQPALSAPSVDAASRLYQVAASEGYEGVQRLVRSGYNLERTDANGNTALCLASLYRNDYAFRALAGAGASTQARCFAAQGKRYPQQKSSGKMIYLGNGLSDTIYGENRQQLESATGFIWPTSYTVGVGLLLLGGAGIAALAASGSHHKSHDNSLPQIVMETGDVLSTTVPSCLGGTWVKDGDSYSCDCGDKVLINGTCVENKAAYQTTTIINDTDTEVKQESDALLAELGARLVNNAKIWGNTNSTKNLVGLKVNGFSSEAYSGELTPDTELKTIASSQAVNNGTIELAQLTTNAGSLYGIKAISGATGTNSSTGTISLDVRSSEPAYGLYAEEEGYGLLNQGVINLNLSLDASDTYGLFAEKRGIVNEGDINIKITNPNFNPSEIDDVAGICADNAQNSGKITLRRGDLPTNPGDIVIANENNLNVYGMWVKNGGTIENATGGLISLDVTKTPYFVQGMYASQGTKEMLNSGRIEIFGQLASKEIENGVGGAFAMRWTGGYGSIINKGEIQSRSCLKDINGDCALDNNGNILYQNLSLVGDAYLTFLNGFRGSITNQADLLLYVTNAAPSTSAWSLSAIHLLNSAEDGSGVFNQADIKIDVTAGTVKKGSSAMGIFTEAAPIQNEGDILIRSKTDNLNLYGMAGVGTNSAYSKIDILGEGANTFLYGFSNSNYTDGQMYITYSPNSTNYGTILLEHHNSGGMLGLSGQNLGKITLIDKPDVPDARNMEFVTALAGESNSGSVSISMQKGSFGFSQSAGSFSVIELMHAYDKADATNKGPLTLKLENRTVNPFVLEISDGIGGTIPVINTDYSYFGGAYGIIADLPNTTSSSFKITNSSVITMDASGTATKSTATGTTTGHLLSGTLTGISGYAYGIVNEANAKIGIDLNGPGGVYGMQNFAHMFRGETLPAIYAMYNEGTIDIRVTNTEGTGSDKTRLMNLTYKDNGVRINDHMITINSSSGDVTDVPFSVIGMITNSIAVNNGHILIHVEGDAKVAGMVAYDGGIAVNNGEIKFTGNADNFVALYGTGYREIVDISYSTRDKEVKKINPDTGAEETYTIQEEVETKTTTKQDSSVFNYGTIIINPLYYNNVNSSSVMDGGDGAIRANVGSNPTHANQWSKVEPPDAPTTYDYSQYEEGDLLDELPVSPLSTTALSTTQSESPKVVTLNSGVNYISEGNASFEAEGNIVSGSVIAGLSNVMDGNSFVYTADGRGNGAIIGNGDSSMLSLDSASYLFDASFQTNANNANGFDIVMTMKSFDDVVDNKSLASFLTNNYAAGNNEAFFSELKSFGDAAAFTSAVNSIMASDVITKFAHEDISAMREINFTMNAAMFANDDKQVFETQGTVNGFNFKDNNNSSGQYALGTKRISPNWKVGYAMSKANINTDNDNDTTRHNEMFHVFAPIGYERNGIKLISTPQIGFARGHYTRKGYNDTSYNGVIEKRIFALMNEARYPIEVGSFEIAPTVEFNAIAFNQRGSEGNKAYALTMPSDNQLSVEAGLGLHANKQVGNVNLNAGLMVYKEFADPYNVKMGMRGMDGSFNLYDDTNEYRGVATFGFDYDVNDWNLYGTVQHFMESDTHTNVKTGLKYKF
ncbi:MAG: hypothetical protein J6P93_03210 [Alphaproteobacteria bacterium]|nr:hypothetical protein [Alphaproteobacteria bacterium]